MDNKMENINNTIFVNYKSENTSISDSVFETPTELTDNLSFSLKNNIIIDYSIGEVEKSDVNKEVSEEAIVE
jgi:hypothetical protein